MKVRFIRADGRRKVGMLGKMTEKKGREMIEKKIVEEYTGPMRKPRRQDKMKFTLTHLTHSHNGSNIRPNTRDGAITIN